MNDFCFNRSAQPQLVVTRGGLSNDRVRSQLTMLVDEYLFSRQQQREPVLPIGPVEDVPPTHSDGSRSGGGTKFGSALRAPSLGRTASLPYTR
ncbi:hypothetical protein OUZ56_011457 [Daphnia magna]|uniref:Uncharacterized protein n=1 Tax=Daphnia magna TaxID=35525 RepID=A0ABQ9Z0K2_9CRUS|nr:hypothetical protein OUZ56_011457 [Daphnia magna]